MMSYVCFCQKPFLLLTGPGLLHNTVGTVPDGKLLPMPAMYREVGKLIAAYRRKKKLSQAVLASHIGHTRTSITNIEAGRQRIPLDLLYKIADVLQTDFRNLLAPPSESLPPEIEKKLPKQFDEAQLRALKRIVPG
jgi:transcriptional regulator with XRE-family HTH domain